MKLLLPFFLIFGSFLNAQSNYDLLAGKNLKQIVFNWDTLYFNKSNWQGNVLIVAEKNTLSTTTKNFRYIQNFKNLDVSIVAVGRYHYKRAIGMYIISEVFVYNHNNGSYCKADYNCDNACMVFELETVNKTFDKIRLFDKKALKPCIDKK